MDKREHCIRFIRSRLPYMSEKELDFLKGFAHGLNHEGDLSEAEYMRPVLSEAEQRNADSAYRLIETVRDALAGQDGSPACCITEEGTTLPPGEKVIGERHGELVVMDISAMMELYREAGWRRVKRSDMLDGLETSGFILPRCRNPKTATICGKRAEVVYVPMILLQESAPSEEPAITAEQRAVDMTTSVEKMEEATNE